MKNPNSKIARAKKSLLDRWTGKDHPASSPRFQVSLFAKDIFTYIAFPILCIFLFKSCEHLFQRVTGHHDTKRVEAEHSDYGLNAPQSQIISFISSRAHSRYSGIPRRTPGTLVKVRLLNVVDTYANAPVDAEIIDAGLGQSLIGSTIIGEASGDDLYRRVNIAFNFVRDINHLNLAIPIKARALSLDGTLGLEAQKKDGFFARAALDSQSAVAAQSAQSKLGGSGTLDGIIARALTSGLLQEFGADTEAQKNNSELLTLKPMTEFYVELTGYFPAQRQ